MSDALSTTIAKAVATALDAATLSQTCVVERVYDPEVSMERLEEMRGASQVLLTVMDATDEEDFESRARLAGDYVIHVGVRAKLAATTAAACDPLVYLCQQIRDLFLGGRMATVAFCQEATTNRVPVASHLRQAGVFFAVVELNFRAERARP